MNQPAHTNNRQRPERIVRGDRSAVITGSDRKISGGVSEPCRLCGLTTTLQLSHVAPRCAYRWIKDEGAVVGVVRSREAVTCGQDGAKHYLLCAACEQHLGSAEDYIATFTRGRDSDLAEIGVTLDDGPTITGLDMVLVYRCLLGVLIKAHHSNAPPFESITVDALVLDRLRRGVLADTYDPGTLSVVATKWISCLEPGLNPRAMLFAGINDVAGTSLFSTTMGGVEWIVRFDGPPLAGEPMPQCELSSAPSVMLFGDITEHRLINHGVFLSSERSRVPPWIDFSPESPCPCGLDATTFKECCAETWVAYAHEAYGEPQGLSEQELRRRRRDIEQLLSQNERMSK